MVVVGNSTMRDLFFRKDVSSIGQSPYRSITEIDVLEGRRSARPASPTRAGGACCRSTRRPASTDCPIISGHVGADAAACLLAIDLAHEDRLVAIMDIGTNTELIVGNRHRILAASCPAGPAFEGGAIACGMPALDGAVETVAARRRRHVPPRRHRRHRPGGPLRLRARRPAERAAPDRPHERDGPVRERRAAGHDRRRARSLSCSSATSTSWPRPRAPTWRACTWCSRRSASMPAISTSSTWRAGSAATCRSMRRSASGCIPAMPASRVVQLGNAAIEGASIALLSRSKRQEARGPRQQGRALPARDASALLRSLRRGLPVQAARIPGPGGRMIAFDRQEGAVQIAGATTHETTTARHHQRPPVAGRRRDGHAADAGRTRTGRVRRGLEPDAPRAGARDPAPLRRRRVGLPPDQHVRRLAASCSPATAAPATPRRSTPPRSGSRARRSAAGPATSSATSGRSAACWSRSAMSREADVREAFDEQARALVEAGADAIIIETQTSLEELGLGLRGRARGRRALRHRLDGVRRDARRLDLPHHDGRRSRARGGVHAGARRRTSSR